MKTFFLSVNSIFLMVLAGTSAFCQKTKEKIGFVSYRQGLHTTGISAGFSLNNKSSLVVLYSAGADERKTGTLLYTENFRLGNEKGLGWFAGAGLHIGSRKITGYNDPDLWVYNNRSEIPRQRTFVMGASTLIGMDYNFSAIPVRVALDVKPFVDFVNGQASLKDVALSVGIRF